MNISGSGTEQGRWVKAILPQL